MGTFKEILNSLPMTKFLWSIHTEVGSCRFSESTHVGGELTTRVLRPPRPVPGGSPIICIPGRRRSIGLGHGGGGVERQTIEQVAPLFETVTRCEHNIVLLLLFYFVRFVDYATTRIVYEKHFIRFSSAYVEKTNKSTYHYKLLKRLFEILKR